MNLQPLLESIQVAIRIKDIDGPIRRCKQARIWDTLLTASKVAHNMPRGTTHLEDPQ